MQKIPHISHQISAPTTIEKFYDLIKIGFLFHELMKRILLQSYFNSLKNICLKHNENYLSYNLYTVL